MDLEDQDARWRGGSVGPHAQGNTVRHVVDDLSPEGSGQQKPQNDPHTNQHNAGVPTTGLRSHAHNTSRNTDCSGRQNTVTRCSTRREARVTV